MGGLFVVVAIVLATDALTRLFKAIWLRIEPPRHDRPAGTPETGSSAL
jgi:hypothetical protein